jgi:hypothetical protein
LKSETDQSSQLAMESHLRGNDNGTLFVGTLYMALVRTVDRSNAEPGSAL